MPDQTMEHIDAVLAQVRAHIERTKDEKRVILSIDICYEDGSKACIYAGYPVEPLPTSVEFDYKSTYSGRPA